MILNHTSILSFCCHCLIPRTCCFFFDCYPIWLYKLNIYDICALNISYRYRSMEIKDDIISFYVLLIQCMHVLQKIRFQPSLYRPWPTSLKPLLCIIVISLGEQWWNEDIIVVECNIYLFSFSNVMETKN